MSSCGLCRDTKMVNYNRSVDACIRCTKKAERQYHENLERYLAAQSELTHSVSMM